MGCSEGVSLGTECPRHMGICRQSLDGAIQGGDDDDDRSEPSDGLDEPPVMTPHDASVLLDAMPLPPDASHGDVVDAGVAALFPGLFNPSFELTAGNTGDVTVLSANGTVIAPWYTCQPIGGGTSGPLSAVRAERSAVVRTTLPDGGVQDVSVTARDGATFVSMQYFAGLLQIPLVQKLTEPLRPGADYEIAVDVLVSNPASRLALAVSGASDNCWASTDRLLTMTTGILSSSWQTVCLPFRASDAYSRLVFAVSADNLLNGNRIYIDNLRPVTDRRICTPPAL